MTEIMSDIKRVVRYFDDILCLSSDTDKHTQLLSNVTASATRSSSSAE